MVVVYTKDNCAPCSGTKKFLTENGVEFEERNIMQDPTAFDDLVAMNFNSVPVVVTPDSTFAGLNIAKLRELV